MKATTPVAARDAGTCTDRQKQDHRCSSQGKIIYPPKTNQSSSKDQEREPAEATSIGPSLIQTTPQATRDWHKELLFGLFLRCNEEELCELTDQAGTSLAAESTEEKSIDDVPERMMMSLPPVEGAPVINTSVLTLVPYALRDLRPSFSCRPETRTASCDSVSIEVPDKMKRKGLASRSLKEVEDESISRFNSCPAIRVGGGLEIIRQDLNSNLKGNHSTSEENGVKDSPTSNGASQRAAHVPAELSTTQDINKLPCENSSSSEPKFEPFSLLFNECSLAAISKWATQDGKQTTRSELEKLSSMDSKTFHRPAAGPFFRRCSCCKNWGHYETECDSLSAKDVLHLAPSTKVQRTLRTFVEKETAAKGAKRHRKKASIKDPRSIIVLNNDAEGTSTKRSAASISMGENDRCPSPSLSDEYLIKSNACEVCASGFGGESLLLCDGCDGLFHFQCLDPPLASVPEGDWFCSKCEVYDSDVSSVVEVEGCEGFVIEQRKRSIAEEDACVDEVKRGVGFPIGGWSTALAMLRCEHMFANGPQRQDTADTDDIEDQSEDASEVNLDIPELSNGELCWAKRGSAPKGMLARDDWWPAIVVVADKQASAIGKMPYVVKFFSLIGTGRIRPSHLLPFFQYYEEIGHARLFNRDMPGYDVYRNALSEATSEIGFKSLAQVLKRAREMTGRGGGKKSSSPGKRRSAAENGIKSTDSDRFKRRRPGKWNGTDSTVVDGIEIFMRVDDGAEKEEDCVELKQPFICTQDREKKAAAKRKRRSSIRNGRSAESKKKKTKRDPNVSVRSQQLHVASADKLVGGIVAWITKKHSDQTEDSHSALLGHLRMEIEPKMHLGIGVSLDIVSGDVLVRILPSLENITASITATRVEASYDESKAEDESPLALHSINLGSSMWVPVESLALIGEATILRAKNYCETRLSSALALARERIAKREAEAAAEREEGMVELVQSSACRRTNAHSNTVDTTDTSMTMGSNPSDGRNDAKNRSTVIGETSASRSAAIASNRGKTNDDAAAHSLGDGIYHAERILDERRKVNSYEYLVKWRGTEESTWEPECNILNQNLVGIFTASRLLSLLNNTAEATDANSLTYRIIRALEKGKNLLKTNVHAPSGVGRKRRLCPFCLASFKDNSSFGSHAKCHSSVPNFLVIKEASKILETSWFG